MFIIRLGVEALKNSDLSLSYNNTNTNDRVKHSILDKIKCRRQFELKKKGVSYKPKKRKGILYNLLKQNRSKPDSIVCVPKNTIYSNDRPCSLNSEIMTPKSLKDSNNSRPSSAPQIFKFHPCLQQNPTSIISSSEYIEISREKLMLDWLRKIVEITKKSYNHDFGLIMSKFYQLNDNNKLTIVKQCWHLLFVTYLAEFIQNSREDVRMILSLLIKDYNKTMGNANYKKNFRITRILTSDLEKIVSQIININMSPNLYHLFRVTILGIVSEPADIEKAKKINFLKSWLLSYHSDELDQMLNSLFTSLSRLDISLMESTFYGHLSHNLEIIIESIYWHPTNNC